MLTNKATASPQQQGIRFLDPYIGAGDVSINFDCGHDAEGKGGRREVVVNQKYGSINR